MSAVNEAIAREYFETLGYLVSQPCKYTPVRHKKADEELDLLIVHPQVPEHRVPDRLVWSSADFQTVARAVVGVRGWHTERFYMTTFEQAPEMLRFAERSARRAAALRLGAEPVAAVLCLPELPASGELKDKTLRALKDRGIDGVVSFRTMMQDLVAKVDATRNYDKSDLLQTLRILKIYGLLRDPQLDLFGRRTRKQKAAPALAVEPGTSD